MSTSNAGSGDGGRGEGTGPVPAPGQGDVRGQAGGKGRPAKPSVEQLGIDPRAQTWKRSGSRPGAVEVAFAGEWVLMRVADDPEARILVYDQFEWECFLDGAKKGEFDNAV